jgi:hypothetical protein
MVISRLKICGNFVGRKIINMKIAINLDTWVCARFADAPGYGNKKKSRTGRDFKG